MDKEEKPPADILEAARLNGTSPLHRLKQLDSPPCPLAVYQLAARCVRIVPKNRPTARAIVHERARACECARAHVRMCLV